MGSKYTVSIWHFVEFPLKSEWRYDDVYASQHLIPALWAAFKEKRAGVGCVRLEIR